MRREFVGRDRPQLPVFSLALAKDSSASASAKISFSPGCGPKSFSAAVTS
jgi:hypothetical protein